MGAFLVLGLFLVAQIVAAMVILFLGHALQTTVPDAGWLPWTMVGAVGVAAAVVFLAAFLNPRWTRWLR